MRCINKFTTLGLGAFENPAHQHTIYSFAYYLIYSQGNKCAHIACPPLYQSVSDLSLSLSHNFWTRELMLTTDRKTRAQRYKVLTKYNAWRKAICSTSSTVLTSLLSAQAHGSACVLVTASTAPLSLPGRGSYLSPRNNPHREGSRPPPSAEDGEGT